MFPENVFPASVKFWSWTFAVGRACLFARTYLSDATAHTSCSDAATTSAARARLLKGRCMAELLLWSLQHLPTLKQTELHPASFGTSNQSSVVTSRDYEEEIEDLCDHEVCCHAFRSRYASGLSILVETDLKRRWLGLKENLVTKEQSRKQSKARKLQCIFSLTASTQDQDSRFTPFAMKPVLF